MEKHMTVAFPGGKRVDCQWGAFTVRTDQSVRQGGEASSPTPFDLFFAAIATCAGISALDYLQKANLSTEGLKLELSAIYDPDTKCYDRIRIAVTPPAGLDAAAVDALLREAADCTVKRHILEPPAFETVLAD